MAKDQAELMTGLGFDHFSVVGHDRGARVVHRLALDHAERIVKAAVLDIAPTLTMYESADMAFASAYYHWFFLIQPFDLPERLIGADPGYYLERKLAAWSRREGAFAPEAVAEYKRCFADPATIQATCEDYRAAASIDLEHDRADGDRRIAAPLLVLWGWPRRDRGDLRRPRCLAGEGLAGARPGAGLRSFPAGRGAGGNLEGAACLPLINWGLYASAGPGSSRAGSGPGVLTFSRP